MSIEKATVWITQQPDIGYVLKTLDSHLRTQDKLGRRIPLPDEYKELEPLVVEYHRNQPKFVKYLEELRDMVPKAAKPEVNGVYRTVMSRELQINIRKRLKRALSVYESKHGELTYAEKIAYTTKVQRLWAAERLEHLKEVRADLGRESVGSNRLQRDDLEEALEAF